MSRIPAKNSSIAAILLASMLLLACGEKTANDTEQKTETATPTTTASDTEEVRWKDNLPQDLDLGGAEITIHMRGDSGSTLEVNVEEEDGDVLNDAIYNRNRDVEERLNVKIVPYVGAGWESYMPELTKVRSSIAAGDNAWQLIASWSNHATSLSFENCFYNLQDIEYLDMKQPWWNQSAVNGMTIGNGTYFVTGDIAVITLLGGSFVLLQNDRLAAQYDIENIPALVREGKWTIDKMTEIIKDVKADLNGDSIMDENDLYGFITDAANSADSWYTSADIHQIVLRDGIPEYVSADERIADLINKIYPLYYGGNQIGSFMTAKIDVQENKFRNGQALMIERELDSTRSTFRDMEDSYTILPFPKLNEEQSQYYTACYNAAAVWGIPSDNPEPAVAAAVLEAMAAESYRIVTPTYFNTCLQEKYARNEESLEMLEIIRESGYLDAEYLYSTSFGETYYVIRDLISQKNSNAASYLAKNVKRYTKAVEKTVEKLDS